MRVGRVIEYHAKGITLTKGPAYVCTAETRNGASGSPVFSRYGPGVRAVVSLGLHDRTNLTDVRCALDLIDAPNAEVHPHMKEWRAGIDGAVYDLVGNAH